MWDSDHSDCDEEMMSAFGPDPTGWFTPRCMDIPAIHKVYSWCISGVRKVRPPLNKKLFPVDRPTYLKRAG